MDFQSFVDSVFSPTCVVSVEKTENGGYGDIRLVAANKKYAELLALRMVNDSSDGSKDVPYTFVPGLLYTEHIPQNTSFEDACYRAAIISIGHVMGFNVISEGVEDTEQLETLKSIGCDYIQGFIWGRPLSADEAGMLVRGETVNKDKRS